MITKLWNKIAEYINKDSDIHSWKDIRKKYFDFSYIAFMSICAHELRKESYESRDMKKVVEDLELVESEILSYIFKLPNVNEFIDDIIKLLKNYKNIDVSSLYQEFLSKDLTSSNGTISLEGGKNSRDVLGSYYTQEEFAYEITKKAIQDYVENRIKKEPCVKIADYSCGGGAFLVAACNICKDMNLSVEIYGYDVDPIAVLITRFRLIKETGIEAGDTYVLLGNPLIRRETNEFLIEKFKLAEEGRFYGLGMGTIPKIKMSIMVGNPPWEKIRFEEKKFLSHYVYSERLGTKTERESYLKTISGINRLYYETFCSDYEQAKKYIKMDSFFSKSSCGELNTYALFTELCYKSICMTGVVGLIIKSSLIKMPVYSNFFRNLTYNKELYEIYMFVNRKKIFNIDSREEFSVIYLKQGNKTDLRIAFDLDGYEKFCENEKIDLPYDLLNKLNPETGMVPNIRNNDELVFLATVYEKQKTFGKLYPNCRFGRLVHLTNHAEFIKKKPEDGYAPIYEGKFIEIYTGKYATFSGMQEKEKYKNKATAQNISNIDGEEYPEARFYINENTWSKLSKNFEDSFIVAWRSLTSATNRRTMLATALPLIPTCQSIQILQLPKADMLRVLAIFNSVVFDYIIRLKMAGLDLTQTIIKQIPIPDKDAFSTEICFGEKKCSIEKHVNSRVKFLYSSDKRLECLFNDIDTYNLDKSKTRKKIIAELDILIATAYGINEKSLKQIIDSFGKYYIKEEAEKWF